MCVIFFEDMTETLKCIVFKIDVRFAGLFISCWSMATTFPMDISFRTFCTHSKAYIPDFYVKSNNPTCHMELNVHCWWVRKYIRCHYFFILFTAFLMRTNFNYSAVFWRFSLFLRRFLSRREACIILLLLVKYPLSCPMNERKLYNQTK